MQRDVAGAAHLVEPVLEVAPGVVAGETLEPRLGLARIREVTVAVAVDEPGEPARSLPGIDGIVTRPRFRYQETAFCVEGDTTRILETREDHLDRDHVRRIRSTRCRAGSQCRTAQCKSDGGASVPGHRPRPGGGRRGTRGRGRSIAVLDEVTSLVVSGHVPPPSSPPCRATLDGGCRTATNRRWPRRQR